jgi:hypothetical protein
MSEPPCGPEVAITHAVAAFVDSVDDVSTDCVDDSDASPLRWPRMPAVNAHTGDVAGCSYFGAPSEPNGLSLTVELSDALALLRPTGVTGRKAARTPTVLPSLRV